jgi:hypothetical protein
MRLNCYIAIRLTLMKMKTFSTTALSKELGISSKELFDKLMQLKLIVRKDDAWHLTEQGKQAGGKIAFSEKYGEFITWPENLILLISNPKISSNGVSKLGGDYLNASKIGEQFNISNRRVNNILAEIGWIEQSVRGWSITTLGKSVGGIERDHSSGGNYVVWPDSILSHSMFLKSIKPVEVRLSEQQMENHASTENAKEKGHTKPENKYPETLLKAKDGHLVRSRAELIIDNLLYDYGLTHAYERELTVAETVFSDFYIPARNGKENKARPFT